MVQILTIFVVIILLDSNIHVYRKLHLQLHSPHNISFHLIISIPYTYTYMHTHSPTPYNTQTL